MGLEVMIDRLERAGIPYEIVGDDRNSRLIVDGSVVGTICEDRVTLCK